MPMLPLHMGWCLPLPIPSSKIALPNQKLTSYPTLKLTTHTIPYQKLNQQLTTHTPTYPKTQQKTQNPHITHPQNTPAKRCCFLPRSLDGSVVCVPTLMRILRAATALCARPGAPSAMPSWLALRLLQQQGRREWIIPSRLVLLHLHQLGLLSQGRRLPPPMGPLPGRQRGRNFGKTRVVALLAC
jgi:hypothetical protein